MSADQPHPFAAYRIRSAARWKRDRLHWLFRDPDGLKALVDDWQDRIAALGAAVCREEASYGELCGAKAGKRHALDLQRSHCRVDLAKGAIAALNVVSTQFVARMVMEQAYGRRGDDGEWINGTAVSTAWLDDQFALTGRRANVKYVDDLLAAIKAKPKVLPYYGALYWWYVEAQARAAVLHTARWQRRHRK